MRHQEVATVDVLSDKCTGIDPYNSLPTAEFALRTFAPHTPEFDKKKKRIQKKTSMENDDSNLSLKNFLRDTK